MTRGKLEAATGVVTADEYRRREAAAMSEAVLQRHTIALATDVGWRYYHAPDNRPNARGRVQRVVAGWPDLVLVHRERRRIMYRELKTQTGRVAPDQVEWLDLLRIAGADVDVWRPIDLLEGRIWQQLTDPTTGA
jgi:hypothetical protein